MRAVSLSSLVCSVLVAHSIAESVFSPRNQVITGTRCAMPSTGPAFISRGVRFANAVNAQKAHACSRSRSEQFALANARKPCVKHSIMQMEREKERQDPKSNEGTEWLQGSSLAKLALVGAVLGPFVDAIHNQVLLQYDILPVSISIANAKTSALIPPLLAMAYAILGGALPPIVRKIVGTGRIREPFIVLPPASRAAAAVLSTAAVIKLSVVLHPLPVTIALPALAAAAVLQWISLDATYASLALGIAAGIGGPIAEIPLMAAGCWHYFAPDYFPLSAFGVGGVKLGLSALTGPCYFAVATDSIALGKWFEAQGKTKGDVK